MEFTEEAKKLNARLTIKKLKGHKFGTPELYTMPTGYAFYIEGLGWYSDRTPEDIKANEGIDQPYTPCGGRSALKSILDMGGFLNYDNARFIKDFK